MLRRGISHHIAVQDGKVTTPVSQITLCKSKTVVLVEGQIDDVEVGDVTTYSATMLGDGSLAHLRDLSNGKLDPPSDAESEFATFCKGMDIPTRGLVFNSLNVVATMDAKESYMVAAPTYQVPDLAKLGYCTPLRRSRW